MGRYSRIGLIKRPQKIDKDKVLSVLKYLGIESIADKLWRELSDGLRQRVLLPRALIRNFDILVFWLTSAFVMAKR